MAPKIVALTIGAAPRSTTTFRASRAPPRVSASTNVDSSSDSLRETDATRSLPSLADVRDSSDPTIPDEYPMAHVPKRENGPHASATFPSEGAADARGLFRARIRSRGRELSVVPDRQTRELDLVADDLRA